MPYAKETWLAWEWLEVLASAFADRMLGRRRGVARVPHPDGKRLLGRLLSSLEWQSNREALPTRQGWWWSAYEGVASTRCESAATKTVRTVWL